MSVPGSIGTTREMTTEERSGHMNYDYTHPSVVAKVTDSGAVVRGLNDVATKRGVKEPVVLQDISAEQHGSWVNGVYTPNEVHGFTFKVRNEGN